MKKWLCGLLLATGLVGFNVHAEQALTQKEREEIFGFFLKELGSISVLLEAYRKGCEAEFNLWVGNDFNITIDSILYGIFTKHKEVHLEGKGFLIEFTDEAIEFIHRLPEFEKALVSISKSISKEIKQKRQIGLSYREAGIYVCEAYTLDYYKTLQKRFDSTIDSCKACQKLYK